MRLPRAPLGPLELVRATATSARGVEPLVRLATMATQSKDGQSPPTLEQRLGVLIERAEAPAALDTQPLDRVWGRLSRSPRGRAPLHVGRMLRWALAATVLLVSGGVVGAELRGWKWPQTVVQRLVRPRSSAGTESGASRATASPRRAERPVVEMPAEGALPDLVAPPADLDLTPPPPSEATPAEKAGQRASHARARSLLTEESLHAPARSVLTQESLHAPARSVLTEESQLLGRALARLRQQRNARGALTDLDAYVARFPSGILLPEARRLRVDALLMEGRLAEARTDLSALDLGAGTRDRELRLIRAELVAEQSCRAALSDYQIVLGEDGDGPLAERAVWGRAACLTRLGDETGARRELTVYVARFPNGTHEAAARARLRD